ncbi:MAG: trypsin-like peptidase domain-containing protein [Pseudomonadota bacterium]
MKRFLCGVVLFCLVSPLSAQSENRVWSKTIERISTGVVSIRIDATRAFDTGWNVSSQATGFVVDAERGLILTNRHVVTPGPVVAEAVFLNNEEVALQPVYFDPVHDFGLYRYDPAELRYIEPAELSLNPDAARVGTEIRVIGNDAGEKLSILAGTLARLDRPAPQYGRGNYNDFNTFYYQAASSTSGGSSGSPVVDVNGDVLALNAGGSNGAASSFFLPLHRVVRALGLIQAEQPVTRGSLQTTFVRVPYDELKRLGLQPETETMMRERFDDQTGMLVVKQVLPGSAAADALRSGDILVSLDDQPLVSFVPLEAALDETVGGSVTLRIQRGGIAKDVVLPVTDLHSITPRAYLEFGDAVMNTLSYQQARHYNLPPKGVFVANPGYMLSNSGIPRGAVIVELAGETIDDLAGLRSVLSGLADDQRVPVRFVTMETPTRRELRILRIDRTWYPANICSREDASGVWPCEALAGGPSPEANTGGTTTFPPQSDSRAKRLSPSLVLVNFDLPFTISGVGERHYYGTGMIVDAERGFVVVDRNTVPMAMGDVTITFAGSLEIPARVAYVHPLHNLAMVQYDPALIGDTPVRNVRFSPRVLKPDDEVWVVGLTPSHRVVLQETRVASKDPLVLPTSRSLRFRDFNIEAYSVVNAPNVDGVLSDSKGNVVASWSSFAMQGEGGQTTRGIPAAVIQEFVDIVKNGRSVYSLETEWGLMPLASARKLGLPEEWLDRLEAHNGQRRQALTVSRLAASTRETSALLAGDLLQPGDILLTVDGQLVSSFREVEAATQKPSVTLEFWRNNELQSAQVATVSLNGVSAERVVQWAGALLQDPYRELARQRGIEPTGVYVAYFSYGSPATRYGLWAGRRIVEVNEQPTPDLDAFLGAVADLSDGESLRLTTLDWNDVPQVITLRLDLQYWPGFIIERDGDNWRRSPLPTSGTVSPVASGF